MLSMDGIEPAVRNKVVHLIRNPQRFKVDATGFKAAASEVTKGYRKRMFLSVVALGLVALVMVESQERGFSVVPLVLCGVMALLTLAYMAGNTLRFLCAPFLFNMHGKWQGHKYFYEVTSNRVSLYRRNRGGRVELIEQYNGITLFEDEEGRIGGVPDVRRFTRGDRNDLIYISAEDRLRFLQTIAKFADSSLQMTVLRIVSREPGIRYNQTKAKIWKYSLLNGYILDWDVVRTNTKVGGSLHAYGLDRKGEKTNAKNRPVF